MKNKATLITEYATIYWEEQSVWRVAQRNPELYIKTELDPIAEDL
jgi:hypothetical protein